MLYLEDYLEMIEHLPQELRDRFTEMRELDLAVQNNMDSLDKKSRSFFSQCKRNEIPQENVEMEFQELRKEYYKVMEDADEKVAIATQVHELVERYLRRLDSELFKFKCELEADNNGITEILEKRSLELDGHNSTAATSLLMNMNQKENRYYGNPSTILASSGISSNSAGLLSASTGISNSGGNVHIQHPQVQQRQRKLEKRRETICTMTVPEKRPNISHHLHTGPHIAPNSTILPPTVRPITNNLPTQTLISAAAPTVPTAIAPTGVTTYSLQQLGGAATSAIAAAASQAIVATQQMQQGRRTASLKASYEAIHGAAAVGTPEFWISNSTTNNPSTAHTTLPNVTATPVVHHEKKQKKKVTTNHNQPNITISSSNGVINITPSTTATPIPITTAPQIVPEPISIITSNANSLNTITVSAIGIPSAMANPVNNAPVPTTINNYLPTTTTTTTTTAAAVVAAVAAAAAAAAAVAPTTTAPTTATIVPATNNTVNDNSLVVEQSNDGEWSYDPNEPRYCTCNQVSYGDMVACDNDACPYEWFHYNCVGITQPPKGKWYCPKCTASMRRRGNRKN